MTLHNVLVSYLVFAVQDKASPNACSLNYLIACDLGMSFPYH